MDRLGFPVRPLRGRIDSPVLRVGLDLDNTSMNNDPMWRERFKSGPCLAETPHRAISDTEHSETYNHFYDICAPCFKHCLNEPEIVGAHPPQDFAAEAVADLYRRGVLFHAITARPESNYDVTVEWLERHGFAESVADVTFAFKKRALCESLGLEFLIDDAPSTLEELVAPPPSSCRVILFDRVYNQDVDADIRLHGWRAVHAYLLDIVRERTEGVA